MNISKHGCLIFMALISFQLKAQNVQLHYDLRHSLDPEVNEKNFLVLSFEYYKELDSLGSFLFKAQSYLKGQDGNIGETFVQLSQTVKFWKPSVYLAFNYSGGLGLANGGYGYYISNAYALGISYPLEWKGAFLTLNAQYRYSAFVNPSYDIQIIAYIWKGMFNYRLVLSGSIVSWTENRNQGTEYTSHLSGKKFAFFGDPQLWYRIRGGFSLGTRINLYYNIIGDENALKVYPTIGCQYKF